MIPELCATIDRFAHRTIDARRIDREHHIPSEVLAGLAELGVFGVTLPEAYGGADLGLPGACAVARTLARHDRSVATTVGLHLGLGTRGLVAYGSPALQEAFLPDLAAGRRLAAFGTTESGAGSDLGAIRTTGVEVDGQLRVDGEKIFVTNGGLAGVYTITASTPGLGGARRGHSLLLLSRDDAGVLIGGEEEKLGLRGSSTTTLYLEGARIPMERVIGVPGEGMAQLAHVLAWGRTVMAAGCVGAATAALDAALGHVRTRAQFGRTLDSFEVVRDQVATMGAIHFAMEATVAAAATGIDLATRSLTAKVLCSEGGWEIADTALQLHGGMGYIEETGLALCLRDARVTRIFEGANDVLRGHRGMMEATAPRGARPPLADLSHAGRTADLVHARVAELRDELCTQFGVRLARQQRQLHRLGQLAILRDACDAAVLHAAGLGTPEAEEVASYWLTLAEARSLPLLAPLAPTDDRLPVSAPPVPHAGGLHA